MRNQIKSSSIPKPKFAHGDHVAVGKSYLGEIQHRKHYPAGWQYGIVRDVHLLWFWEHTIQHATKPMVHAQSRGYPLDKTPNRWI